LHEFTTIIMTLNFLTLEACQFFHNQLIDIKPNAVKFYIHFGYFSKIRNSLNDACFQKIRALILIELKHCKRHPDSY